MSEETICGYKVHPAAALFPMLFGEEFEELKGDIKRRGQQEPLMLIRTDDGTYLLDGRNRGRALDELGIKPEVDFFEADDPIEHVISANLRRRHMNESQRAMTGGRLKPMYEQEAEERRQREKEERAAALEAEKAASAAREEADDEIEETEEEPEVEVPKIEPKKTSGAIRDQVARDLNVGSRTVGRAEKVLENGVPELIRMVDDGTIKVDLADQLCKRTPEEQIEAIRFLKEELEASKSKNPKSLLRRYDKNKIIHSIQSEPQPLPDGPFRVIVSDYPWEYEKRKEDGTQRGQTPYPTMTIEEGIQMGPEVSKRAHLDAILWFWTTNAHMPVAHSIVEAWGFTHKTILTWKKGHPSVHSFELMNPDRQGYSREAWLYLKGGFAPKDIADVMGISPWSIRYRLKKQGIVLVERRGLVQNKEVLDDRQMQVLDGEMLGDGSIQFQDGKDRVARLRWTLKSRGHVDLLMDEFSELGPNLSPRSEEEDRYGWHMWTEGNLDVTTQRHRWYPDGEKRVPRDLRMTPLVAFHWYIGDGSLDRHGSITLCSEGFSRDDNLFLSGLLQGVGIDAGMRNCDRGSGTRIALGVEASRAFLKYIGHCRVADYAHKWGVDPDRVLEGSDKMGTGDWLRGVTEHCIVAVRGKPTVDLTNQTTFFEAPATGNHSEKPEKFYEIVEGLCPGSKLEMFSRRNRDGWVSWGAETGKLGD